MIVPALVVTQVVYFIAHHLGADAEVRFLGDLAAGEFIVKAVAASDWQRMAELVNQYRDLPLGSVDASIVAAAERVGIIQLATLDRRHFSIVRPSPTHTFELLP